jgi:hypothetical protein
MRAAMQVYVCAHLVRAQGKPCVQTVRVCVSYFPRTNCSYSVSAATALFVVLSASNANIALVAGGRRPRQTDMLLDPHRPDVRPIVEKACKKGERVLFFSHKNVLCVRLACAPQAEQA